MSEPFAELDAFVEECRLIEQTLADVPEGAWARPGLGEWTLGELTAHVMGGAARLDEYLGKSVEAATASRDRVSYFRYDPEAIAAEVAERARRAAAELDPADLPSRFAEAWRRSAASASAASADRLVAPYWGVMRLDEYTATRVLEMVVHHMDIRGALDLPPLSSPSASRMTMELLEGLLGAPRPRNMGRTRFILAATGRLEVEDPRFPVMG
ncbi:MAG TPA: maleylpyruvate isomerase N-terminal domain-containing protein [Egibacteraceae bacterium]|nr:maleylpyruvate isomerase N-terminal domain-containing protein [Egibacteraceae bacterium]